MSRRGQIAMTPEEIDAFLDQRLTLQVASINADGTPHLVAMWYAVLDGDVVFWTYGRSQKIVNLERDPRITVMCESGQAYEELKGVSITGRAELASDDAIKERIGKAVYLRYFGGEWNDAAAGGVAYAGRKRTVVTVKADKIVSWDHAKLGGSY